MAIRRSFKIAQDRKEMRSKRRYEEYRKLNPAFQKKARQDKEQSIINKYQQIEDNNKMGKKETCFKK